MEFARDHIEDVKSSLQVNGMKFPHAVSSVYLELILSLWRFSASRLMRSSHDHNNPH